MNNEAVIEELFESFKKMYQNQLEELMKGSEFLFDQVYSLYYKCHKINPNHGGSYIGSPNWIKKSNNKSYQ